MAGSFLLCYNRSPHFIWLIPFGYGWLTAKCFVTFDSTRHSKLEGRRVCVEFTSPPFWSTVHCHTGGQALFTVELLRMLREQGDLIKDAKGNWIEDAKLDWNALPVRVEGVIANPLFKMR